VIVGSSTGATSVSPSVDALAIIRRRTRSPARVIRSRGAGPDDPGMVLTQPGSAAGGAVDAPQLPERAIPQPADPDWLLDAVRRGLVPGDPVARLLAGWTAPPAGTPDPLVSPRSAAIRAAGTPTG
jgi:hypothetical protein